MYQRSSHFMKHGADVGAVDELAYEAMADAFMFGQMNADTRDCTRPNGDDYVRMDLVKTDFGVSCVSTGFLRTFYKPPATKIKNRGGPAMFLASECARMN